MEMSLGATNKTMTQGVNAYYRPEYSKINK
jgi:hypothetical protein